MIKEEKVIIPAKPAQPEKIITKKVPYCDVCKKACVNDRYYVCEICERILCAGLNDYCALYDYPTSGDYKSVYCPICYNLKFDKYKKAIEDAEAMHDKLLEDFKRVIKLESLATKI